MAHSQVRLTPQRRTTLLQIVTDKIAMMKTVPKIREGARGPAPSVYLA